MRRRKLYIILASLTVAVLLIITLHRHVDNPTDTVIISRRPSFTHDQQSGSKPRSGSKNVRRNDNRTNLLAHQADLSPTNSKDIHLDQRKECEGNPCCENNGVKRKQQQMHEELPPKHTGGYMLSFRYYEQQTQGVCNLLQMQCLAHSFQLKIVEPFVVKSAFQIPISSVSTAENLTKKYLSLGDLVDMRRWNLEAYEKFGFTSMALWEDFLLNAPRKVIAHCIKYRNPPNIQVPIPGFNYQKGCSEMCFDKFTKSMEYLGAFGFHVVQRSCSNFVDYAGSVTQDSFFNNIMGEYSSAEVTVLINEFRGFYGLYRLPVLSQCGIAHHKVNISIVPSQRIIADACKYTSNVFQRHPYAAVVARIERVVLHLHENVSACSQEIVQILKKLKNSHGISDTFLAMDVGKFGSSGSVKHNLQPLGETLFSSLYSKRWSFHEWETSFESSASSDNPAYVANLQRTIAASSRCLILFGGGGFQNQARSLYETFHPDPKSWCIHRVCNREVE